MSTKDRIFMQPTSEGSMLLIKLYQMCKINEVSEKKTHPSPVSYELFFICKLKSSRKSVSSTFHVVLSKQYIKK